MPVQFTDFAFVLLADVFDTYTLAVLVLLFSRISRLTGIVSTGLAHPVLATQASLFSSRCSDLITACSRHAGLESRSSHCLYSFTYPLGLTLPLQKRSLLASFADLLSCLEHGALPEEKCVCVCVCP